MILLGIGSNLGDRDAMLTRAAERLAAAGIQPTAISVAIETPALLPHGAPPEWNIPFLNQAIRIESGLPPEALLAALKRIETEMGRQDRGRWGPREIDIDLLAYGEVVMDTPSLTLPHPGIAARRFVLSPLNDIVPGWQHPVTRLTPAQMLAALRPTLVGILNITPDSFSDGGQFLAPDAACARIAQLAADGADIIDMGAESTRPGAVAISAEEEWARLSPILQYLPAVPPISLDTRHALTAQRALAAGVTIINDQGGLRDAAMRAVLAASNCRIIAMHALTLPVDPAVRWAEDIDPIAEILRWKQEAIARAEASSIASSRLIFDPGIGFGKSAVQSMALVARAGELVASGGEWLYGHSRKSFLGGLVEARDATTLAISHQLAAAGVQYLRVHDIKGHVDDFTR